MSEITIWVRSKLGTFYRLCPYVEIQEVGIKQVQTQGSTLFKLKLTMPGGEVNCEVLTSRLCLHLGEWPTAGHEAPWNRGSTHRGPHASSSDRLAGSWESLGKKMSNTAVSMKCEVGRTGPTETAQDSGIDAISKSALGQVAEWGDDALGSRDLVSDTFWT